jgi:hypothetical protein
MHYTYQPLTYDTFHAARYHEPVDDLLTDDYGALNVNDQHHRTSVRFAVEINDDICFAGDTVDMAPHGWARTQAGRRTLGGLTSLNEQYDDHLRCHHLDEAWWVLQQMAALFAVGIWLRDTFDDDDDGFDDVDADSIVTRYCAALSDDARRTHAVTFCEHLAACDPHHIISIDAAHLCHGRPLLQPELFATVAASMAQRLHARIATAAHANDLEQLAVLVALAAGAQRIVERLRDGQVTL